MSIAPNSAPPQSLRTVGFVSLCAIMGSAYLHQGLMMAMVPLYVVSLGHSETAAGVVLALFSLASLLGRPAFGRLADRRTARAVVNSGCVLMAVGAGLHALPLLGVIALASTVRGVGWGALNTGANAALVALSPPARRGFSSSVYNIFQNSAMAAAPAIGLMLISSGQRGYALVFALSAGLAVLGGSLSRPLVKGPELEVPPTGVGPIRAAALPSALVGLFMVTQPAMIIFVPLYAKSLGFPASSVAWYYLLVAGLGVVARLLMGAVSDRIGRHSTIFIGFTLASAALGLMVVADVLPVILLGGVLYTCGQAMAVPAATALAMDRIPPGGAGRVMAMFTGAFQAGMGIGSLTLAAIIDFVGYRQSYAVAAIAMVAVTIVLLVAAVARSRSV